MTIIFMHHDIVDNKSGKKSGFYGAGAEVYKVPVGRFRAQLQGLAEAFPGQQPGLHAGAPFALTFDDGGVSATEIVAEALAAHKWGAHFFVVTGFIGMRNFVSASGLRALKTQGHQIGTHTVTHPARLRSLAYRHILNEWIMSRSRLEDILGCTVNTGSVPGGHCTKSVRDAAAEAGLTTLFTSEPTIRGNTTSRIAVRGRFAVLARDEPEIAVALAKRAYARRLKAFRWHALSVAKGVLGPVYPPLREGLLRLRVEKGAV